MTWTFSKEECQNTFHAKLDLHPLPLFLLLSSLCTGSGNTRDFFFNLFLFALGRYPLNVNKKKREKKTSMKENKFMLVVMKKIHEMVILSFCNKTVNCGKRMKWKAAKREKKEDNEKCKIKRIEREFTFGATGQYTSGKDRQVWRRTVSTVSVEQHKAERMEMDYKCNSLLSLCHLIFVLQISIPIWYKRI